MFCRNCGYSLWGLSARACPECGSAFRPGDYEFVPNSVQFRCPHCQQPYYGTSPQGHLVPDEFDCVSCGQYVRMDEMVLFPAEGLHEEQTRTKGMPWLDRRDRGLFRAWLSTIGMAMIKPGQLMAITPVQSSTGAAIGFAWLSQILFCLSFSVIVPFFLLYFLISGTAGTWMPGISGVVGILYLVIIGGLCVWVLIWPLAAHLVLRITGGTRAGLGRTYQAMCYSSGANVFLATPCFGMHLSFIGYIWWAVSAILMLRTGQRVHGLRATLAVLSLPVGLMVFGMFMTWMGNRNWPVSTAGARLAPVTIPATPEQQEEVAKLAAALRRYGEANEGKNPVHALDLVVAGLAGPVDFSSTTMMGDATEVRIGRLSLDEMSALSAEQQRGIAATLGAQLPPEVTAHRLGDFVFTYHGIRRGDMDPGLWVVVLAPRPAPVEADPSNGSNMFGNTRFEMDGVIAGTLDETTRAITAVQLPAALKQQNELRARHDLPPLPDPRNVTASQPAAGEPARS